MPRRWQTVDLPRPFDPVKRGEHWYTEIDGREVRLSNLTKVWWPERGYTKGDCLAVYFNVAPLILPHLRDRPLTLWRMPDGRVGDSFFEKQAPSHTPDWVPRAYIEGHGPRPIDFLLAQDVASLLFVSNLGCIEMHPLHSRQFNVQTPDYLFFDLDPFPPITFDRVRRVALMVRAALDQLGLRSYPKTSGATGMQVYVPLDGTHGYDEARALTERVCRLIHRTWPEGTTMEWEIAKRAGKVFLDYAMVREAANIASAYSVRPSEFAGVSTPLRWEEVEQDVEPHDFTIETVWDRFAQHGDLFAPVLDGGTPKGQNLRHALEDLGIDRAQFAPVQPARGPSPAEPLKEYKRKRRFDITPEPAGRPHDEAPEKLLYMVHKHHARRLHFDLRLERGGVMVSFAVPKGLPEEPGIRHLAVHVEDHPIEYASFEGTIPEGQYGAGEVRIFDTGWYEPLEWTDDKITLRLHGERVQGEYHLVHTKQGGDPKNWLIFRSSRQAPLQRPPAPPLLEPMLATAGGKPFDDPEWLFEPKWDGVRTLAWIDGDSVKLLSRRRRDVTELYPELGVLPTQLAGKNALVDGEIVALDEAGRPSFERIQQRFTVSKPTTRTLQAYPVDYVAFDLLWLDGESLLERELEERRALLERHLVPGAFVQISPQIPERGAAFFEVAKAQGLEGLIAKKRGSLYRPGQRSKDWVKIKALRKHDCVIVGWSPGQGGRTGSLGALVVGVYRDGELQYAGHVGTGFTDRTLATLQERLRPLEVPDPPVRLPPRSEVDLRGVRWVRPELVCSVEYLEFTSSGRLRAPSFKGLREEVPPEEAVYSPEG